MSKKCQVLDEGCLSFPDTMVSVSRRARIDIEYLDLDGKEHAERVIGFEARIIQHEIDHLDGVRAHCDISANHRHESHC